MLRVREGRFELVDQGGRFILKPPNAAYPRATGERGSYYEVSNGSRSRNT